MVPINTHVDVDYFFKWFTWNSDYHSIGFALTKDAAHFYESVDPSKQPKLVEILPINNKQRKMIKQYLFSYQDLSRKPDQYANISTDPFVYNLKGYYRNIFVNKKVVGDCASIKLKDSIFKILNNQPLTPSDDINYDWR